MSNQVEFPFRESAEDATHAAINKSGVSMKKVALDLWPALKLDSAYARLRGCLNPDRPEKLSADEHITIAQLTGQYDFLHYCAMELDHERPQKIEPEDKRARLQREFIEHEKRLERILRELHST